MAHTAETRSVEERKLRGCRLDGAACYVHGVRHRKLFEVGGVSRMFASMLYGKTPP